MKKQKIATVVTCFALVGAVAVGGTLALVTSTAKTMTNTFTVGNGYENGDFKLYENGVTLIDSDAEETDGRHIGDYVLDTLSVKDADQSQFNNYSSVIPGATLDKNPWFELAEGSGAPESWVVARVSVDDLTALKNAGITIETVANEAHKWHAVYKDSNSVWKYDTNAVTKDSFAADSDKVVGGYLYFVYDTTIDTSTSTTGIDDHTAPLFTQLKADTNLETITNYPLTIKGVAVQKLGDATSPEAAIDTIMTDATGVLGN